MGKNQEAKTQPAKEVKENELTEKQLEKAAGGLKMAPTAVDVPEGQKEPLKAPPL